MLYRAILFLCLFGFTSPIKTLEVDTHTLTGLSRRAVVEAEESWTRQTRGCIQFKEDLHGVKIIRMTPPDKYDTDGTYTVGMCTGGVGDCRIIEIAFSKVPDFDTAVVIAAHEIGHALGLYHVCGNGWSDPCRPDDHSLMNPNGYKAYIRLSPLDRAELKRATGCSLD